MEPNSEDPLVALVRERFGLSYLFPFQRLVMANILDTIDDGGTRSEQAGYIGELRQIVLLPTGFGKSLCFQLPALRLPGPTLVIYPLLALMEDQRRRLEELGIPCAIFRGGQTRADRRSAENSIMSGETKIAIINPECLAQDELLEFFKRAKPSHIAIDEAHCVSEWGETFRPAYLELGRIVEELNPPALSAFTATASPAVFEAIARILFGGLEYRVIEGDPDRPNIHYSVIRTLSREHSLTRLARQLAKPLIVFCSSRDGVQILARMLRGRLDSEDVRFYHAGLERHEKKAVEEWFYSSENGILVSTCAYGMGVDKKNIRTVIHFEAPTSVEAYLQEAGRAGRDGLPSKAVLLSSTDEESRFGKCEEGSRKERYRAFLAYAKGKEGCRRALLLDLLGASGRTEGPCSGCDRCDGYAEEMLEGEKEISVFFSGNSRRFDKTNALRALAGEGMDGPRCWAWGCLSAWNETDRASALGAAHKVGIVKTCARGPWKGRIANAGARKRRRIPPES